MPKKLIAIFAVFLLVSTPIFGIIQWQLASAVSASSISPNWGYVTGGETVTISGSDFSDQYCRDTSRYVQSGLIMHLDGINNTGSGHDGSTSTWTDLTGNGNSGSLRNFGSGVWADDHLVFSGQGGDNGPWVRLTRMEYSSMSIEAVVELSQYPTNETDNVGYNILANVDAGGSVLAVKQNGRPVHKAAYNRVWGVLAYYSTATGSTALGLNQVHSLFGSYSSPTNTLINNGSIATATNSGSYQQPLNSTVWAIGTNPMGSNSSLYGSEQLFTGKVYGARIYNRTLSQSEVAQNQKVDVWRFGEKKNDPCFTVRVDGQEVPYTIVDSSNMTITMPEHAAGIVSVTIYNEFDEQMMLTANYEYKAVATTYTNECREDNTSAWTAYPYVPQGSTTECRIVLDGPFSGSIALFDDYHNTIDAGLSGVFASSDGRFSNKQFNLSYADTVDTSGQILYYTYTAPSAATLESYYALDESDEERGDNGYDLFWPLLGVTVTPTYASADLDVSGDEVLFGLLAEKYYIEPLQENAIYCTNCSSSFVVSTHGAPYFGTVSLTEDLANSDNPGGASGSFSTGERAGNIIDFSALDGADAEFTYTPKTTATDPNFIRIQGASATPTITDSYIDIFVEESGLSITGPSALKRGETGTYTLRVTMGSGWAGSVELSDPFASGGVANGLFADITVGLTDTYDPLTKTYTFTNSGEETYIRTFEYTMRNDSVVPPAFTNYQINLTGNSNSPIETGWASVHVVADKLSIKCGSGYPNCTTQYVGELKDFSISPNGTIAGSATITDNSGGGSLGNNGNASWSSATPFVISYTPGTPGRKTLTATVNTSSNSAMVGQSYNSTSSDSLNSYIYVMANSMALSGYRYLSHAQSGSYTLTMNGPFVGTIYLDALLANNTPAGGVFSNGGGCTFTLANYNDATNTTSCSFTYTPNTVNARTDINLVANPASGYGHAIASTPATLTVFPPIKISNIAPDHGPGSGGTEVTITGQGFLPYRNGALEPCYANGGTNCADVILDIENTPAVCQNVKVLNDTTITCTTISHVEGTVSLSVDNGLEDDVLANAYTYVGIFLAVSPNILNIDVSPSPDGTLKKADNTLTVSTNSPNGYNLSLEMSSTERRLRNSASTHFINSTGGDWYSPIALSANTWGFATDDAIFNSDTFAAIPAKGSPQIIRSTGIPVTNENTKVYIGVKADMSLPVDTYSGEIIYTATAAV